MSDVCAFCGARAIRDIQGEIAGWAANIGYNGAGHHEHETIEGER